jgi:lysylphosphatidylglycerol synthetase-like protein (DUF2156 family)
MTELEARSVAEVRVPLGGRVLVVADLFLTASVADAGPTRPEADVVAALDAFDGPAVVVFAGGLFDLLTASTSAPVEDALAAHPELVGALRRFTGRVAGGEGELRRALCLPGARDAALAWDPAAQRVLRDELGVEVVAALDVVATTAAGERRVRVEAGHCFDPRFAAAEGPVPGTAPFGSQVLGSVVPALDARWGAGAARVDVSLLPRFVASRVLYRRIARWGWLLLVPFLVALAVKVPLSAALTDRFGPWSRRLGLAALTTAVDVVLFAGAVAAMLNRGWRSILGPRPATGHDDAARAEARRLVATGYAGLVVGHPAGPELVDLGAGFFAAAGGATELVVERRGRLALPPVFVPVHETDWLELEAGAELHVHLHHARADAPGATLLERLAGGREPVAVPDRGARSRGPNVVATWPGGPSWPVVEAPLRRVNRVRRRAATAIAVAGLLDLLSGFTPPFQDRLAVLLKLVPLAVPQAATALVAAAGLGLIALARGVRRGQRDAWRVAVALLAGSVALHVVKGADIEEATAALVVAGYLVVHRDAFRARTHRVRIREGVTRLALLVPATLLGAVAALELVTEAYGPRLPLGRATVAVAARLVGASTVALPDRIDDFARPTLTAIGAGFLVWFLSLAVRPAVARRSANDAVLRARALVNEWASGTLDYFALRDDKSLFTWESSVVAYAVHHGVCLVSPDPIGPEWEREGVWAAFRRFTDEHGWTVAVLGAGERWLDAYRSFGMHDLYVGDEAVVDVRTFSLEGGRHKSLRQAVNRVANHGYTISFHDPAQLPADLRAGVETVMGKSRRGDVERGFSMTLGRIFDPNDRGLLLAVCHSPDGEPVAFCQYVPAPGIRGFSLDLMRRDAGTHPNGLLDFVIVRTIEHLRQEGFEHLGLNFATMRAVLAGELGDGLVGRVERWALRRMSGSMQIESLWRFNAKFDPEWLPRYVVYDSPEHFVPVAFAIARAESFWELPVIGRWLVPSSTQAPAP